MNAEVQSTLQRLTAKEDDKAARKDPVTRNSVTNSFYPKGKFSIHSGIRLEPDSLLAQVDAERLIGKKIVSVKGTADDLEIMLEDNTIFHINISGDKPILRTS